MDSRRRKARALLEGMKSAFDPIAAIFRMARAQGRSGVHMVRRARATMHTTPTHWQAKHGLAVKEQIAHAADAQTLAFALYLASTFTHASPVTRRKWDRAAVKRRAELEGGAT